MTRDTAIAAAFALAFALVVAMVISTLNAPCEELAKIPAAYVRAECLTR